MDNIFIHLYNMEINNKQVIITGGASGIGLECVKLLLKHGAKKVMIIDIHSDNIKKCEEILNAEFDSNQFSIYLCNVANVKEFEDTFKEVVDDNGRIDIVVNNAGIFNDNNWEETIKTNLIGSTCCLLLAMRHMSEYRNHENGVIVNMSSISGINPIYGCPIYSATKAAIISLGRSFSSPFFMNKYGIRVMNICPGLTYTGMAGNLMDKFLSPSIRDEWYRLIQHTVVMDPADVAEEIVRMIRYGRNGATWVYENGEPSKEVMFKHEKSKL